MVYNMAPVASDVTRESHALDVITSISRYDSRSKLLHFFNIVDSYKQVNNQRKCTVAFPLQQYWSESAKIFSYT